MRSTELLVDDYVASFRTESYLNGIGKSVDTFLELFASLDVGFYIFLP